VSAKDLQTNQIACSRNAKPVKSFGKAKAGDNVVIQWTKWSECEDIAAYIYILLARKEICGQYTSQ